MKKIMIALTVAGVLVGCGGGGDNASPNNTSNGTSGGGGSSMLPKYVETVAIRQANSFDVDEIGNIVAAATKLTKDNYIDLFKKVHAMELTGFPELNTTFDINNSKSSRFVSNKISRKVIYQNASSRKDEYQCKNGGFVSKEVRLAPNSHLDAATYRDGDNTEYAYSYCDYGSTKYNGRVTYHVNDFTKYDFQFGAIPLGVFESRFNSLSVETDKQKITLNGTISFTAQAEYKPKPDGSLIKLEKRYDTVGDFVVKVYDKQMAETTELIYHGMLNKESYNQTSFGDASSDASIINSGTQQYIYRKRSNYRLTLQNGERSVMLNVYDNQPSIQGEIRPVGYDKLNSSILTTALDIIYQMPLADGTTKYVLDINADYLPDETVVEGTPHITLPPSDIDLMDGVVVIGFDDCPYTTSFRQRLEKFGILYHYVNIRATQQEYDILDWFQTRYVPYVGINGSYVAAAHYNSDKYLPSSLLKLRGIDIADDVVKQHRGEKAAVNFQRRFEELQAKNAPHTAMAVANDKPYYYNSNIT